MPTNEDTELLAHEAELEKDAEPPVLGDLPQDLMLDWDEG